MPMTSKGHPQYDSHQQPVTPPQDQPESTSSKQTSGRKGRTIRSLTFLEQRRVWESCFRGKFYGKCSKCVRSIAPYSATYVGRHRYDDLHELYHIQNILPVCPECASVTSRPIIPSRKMSIRRATLWVMFAQACLWLKCSSCSAIMNMFDAWDQGHNQAHARNGCGLSHNMFPICRTCNHDCSDYPLVSYTRDMFRKELPSPVVTESAAKAEVLSMRARS